MPTVNDILTSISSLRNEEKLSEIEYDGIFYPVIEQDDLRFAVLPTGVNIYKVMPSDYSLNKYYKIHGYPFPSFYASNETASIYLDAYYPQGGGSIYKFRTTRPTKLLVLNDINNLIELCKLFSHTKGVKGFLKRSKKEAIRELMMVTGLGTHCLVQEEFRQQVEDELNLNYEDYKLNTKLCEQIKDEELKRLSLYAIDLQFSRNLCIVMKKVGGDGYIADDMPTAFGETIPVFHQEVMYCFTKDVLEQEQNT